MKAVDDRRIQAFRKRLAAKEPHYVESLKRLCNLHCGSEMIEGVEQAAQMLGAELEELGFSVSRVPAEGFADHLLAHNNLPGKQILLGGHIDTTYTDYSELPSFHVDGKIAVGPGTADMKGGIVGLLAALDCLKAEGMLDSIPITVLLNSDEERGAPTARQIFEAYAENCQCALFFECAGKNNEIVVARRGKLSYQLNIAGVVKHAGERGSKVSALEELSHKIVAIEGLNKDYPGDSFNVGRAWGGIASNTIPGEATALMDVRFTKQQAEDAIRDALSMICDTQYVVGTLAKLEETSYRPVWEKGTDQQLFQLAQSLGSALGHAIKDESRGGTADVNWFGARGIPALDGLGPVGFDDHTPGERIILHTLFERALLVAALIASLE